jgi:WD40 repeat protein
MRKPVKEIIVLRGHINELWSASFSPDGKRVVTASSDNTARIWDAETGEDFLPRLLGTDNGFGQHLLVLMANALLLLPDDSTARIWDADTGDELTILAGHVGPVYKAAFSPDGMHIVTTSFDKTARLWNAAPWRSEDLPQVEGTYLHRLKKNDKHVCSSGNASAMKRG